MQTTALLVDSFRMMVARRLFWITLAINLLVVLVYGSLGSNQDGLSVLFGAFTLDIPIFAHDSEMYRSLIQLIFSGFLVPIWLAWIATILALVTTTSVFPDFQEEGAIDIVLSKPISRALGILEPVDGRVGLGQQVGRHAVPGAGQQHATQRFRPRRAVDHRHRVRRTQRLEQARGQHLVHAQLAGQFLRPGLGARHPLDHPAQAPQQRVARLGDAHFDRLHRTGRDLHRGGGGRGGRGGRDGRGVGHAGGTDWGTQSGDATPPA